MPSTFQPVLPTQPKPLLGYRTLKWFSIAALVFGLVTVASGGRALFGSLESRTAVGQAVPFVLWFNFLAGFVYVLAGAGLLWRRPWAAYASLFVAVSTLLVFSAFGIHVIGGGTYEPRTVGAMTLRSLFWIALAIISLREMKTSQVFQKGDLIGSPSEPIVPRAP